MQIDLQDKDNLPTRDNRCDPSVSSKQGFHCREGLLTCFRKSCTILCSETCEPMGNLFFSCLSIFLTSSWSVSEVKPSAPTQHQQNITLKGELIYVWEETRHDPSVLYLEVASGQVQDPSVLYLEVASIVKRASTRSQRPLFGGCIHCQEGKYKIPASFIWRLHPLLKGQVQVPFRVFPTQCEPAITCEWPW